MSQDIARWLEEAGTFKAHIHCHELTKQWSNILNQYTTIACFPDEECDTSFPVMLSEGDPLDDNWLITGNQGKPAVFKFKYHSSETNRIFVSIHGTGANQGKQVDISRNGYLGLYQNASNVVQMKLEPLEWGEDTLRCRIRDHQGHTVKVAYNFDTTYLSIDGSDAVTFVIKRLNA